MFKDGVIQQLSSPADLYERPENSFVAQFIGENNRWQARSKTSTRAGCAPSGSIPATR